MPINSSRMIPRKKLLSSLDILAGEQILYLCAPAGYGKTVLARQWLVQGACKSAIITLDEFDNDTAYFCLNFCQALCECQPRNLALKRVTTHASFNSAPEEFAIRAIAALSKSSPARLAVDDLNFIHNEKTLLLLTGFLKRLPENFRIMLSSRNELPGCLSGLLLKGELSRITAEQLRFDNEEIISLYEKQGRSISRDKAEEIRQFTDGWAIGLGALLLSGDNSNGESPEYLEDFIRENIWRHLDESVREFMIKTAALRELTPPLCAAVTGVRDSKSLLEQFAGRNIFITQMGNGVYRYHRLLRDFLRKLLEQRGREYYNKLLNKAGNRYISDKDFYNAMDCFIESESYDGIAQCVAILITMGREYVPTETLFPIARSPVVQRAAEKHPNLYSMLSWAAFSDGRAEDMAKYADCYYTRQSEIAGQNPSLLQSIIFVRLVDFRNPLSELLKTVGEISSRLPGGRLNDMRLSIGTLNQNMPLLHRGTRDFSEFAAGDIKGDISVMFGAMQGLFGDEAPLLGECLLAGLLYEQGRLEEAHIHALTASGNLQESFLPETKFFATALRVCILEAMGQEEPAAQAFAHIGEMIDSENAYYLLYNWNALKTQHMLRAGDAAAAQEWLAEHEPSPYSSPDFYRLCGHFTTCRAYMCVGEYDNAIILLKKLTELVSAYNRPLDVIEANVLLSICFWRKKRSFQAEALGYLERAAGLAHGFGFIQIFLNEGAELSAMLHRLYNRTKNKNAATAVSASFVKGLYLKTLTQRNASAAASAPPAMKYTEKQKTVMRLLCEGKSYREISDEMNIKIPTLRSHIALIYKKLDVTQGTDAVVKINSLGILK